MIDLYFWTTPNGYKPLILLEEAGIDYRIVPVNISTGDQFGEDFLRRFPNARIPALVDRGVTDETGAPLALFESGAILQYLAEKTGRFLPGQATDPAARARATQWLFWQMAAFGPTLGQLMHFGVFSDTRLPYAINRFHKEAERLYAVLDGVLAESQFVAGDYGVADMAIYPWVKSAEARFPELASAAPNIARWSREIAERPAVIRAYEIGAAINTTPTFTKESRKVLLVA